MQFNHIGIFVKNINLGIREIKKVIQIKKKSKIIKDKNLKVKIIFLYDEKKLCYELIEPYGKKNPVSNTLKKNINILNHLAYEASNFDSDVSKLINSGFRPITKAIKAKAFSGRLEPLELAAKYVEYNNNVAVRANWKNTINIEIK